MSCRPESSIIHVGNYWSRDRPRCPARLCTRLSAELSGPAKSYVEYSYSCLTLWYYLNICIKTTQGIESEIGRGSHCCIQVFTQMLEIVSFNRLVIVCPAVEELETYKFGRGKLGKESLAKGYGASPWVLCKVVVIRQFRTYWRNTSYRSVVASLPLLDQIRHLCKSY